MHRRCVSRVYVSRFYVCRVYVSRVYVSRVYVSRVYVNRVCVSRVCISRVDLWGSFPLTDLRGQFANMVQHQIGPLSQLVNICRFGNA